MVIGSSEHRVISVLDVFFLASSWGSGRGDLGDVCKNSWMAACLCRIKAWKSTFEPSLAYHPYSSRLLNSVVTLSMFLPHAIAHLQRSTQSYDDR